MTKQQSPYQIFFFGPGETRMRIGEFDSPLPPPSYNAGDIIDARYWDKMNWEPFGGPLFRVRCVEHKISAASDNENMAEVFQIGIYLDRLDRREYEKLIGAN